MKDLLPTFLIFELNKLDALKTQNIVKRFFLNCGICILKMKIMFHT